MAYTLSSVRNQVIDDKLDDTSFDPAVVDRFINATQREIFNHYELPFMEKIFSGTLPIGEHAFTMPSDLQVLQSVVVTAPDGSQKDITGLYMPYRDFDSYFPTPQDNEAGPITHWTSYGGVMYTSVPIDATYTMDIKYIKKPTELSDDADVPEVPEEFQEALVLGAFKRVLQRNEDYDLAAAVNNDYQSQLDMLVARYGYRLTGGPIIMKQPNRRSTRTSRGGGVRYNAVN